MGSRVNADYIFV